MTLHRIRPHRAEIHPSSGDKSPVHIIDIDGEKYTVSLGMVHSLGGSTLLLFGTAAAIEFGLAILEQALANGGDLTTVGQEDRLKILTEKLPNREEDK